MARINLLPWREELRQKRQQDFLIAIGAGVVLTCILFGMAYSFIEGLKEDQVRRNEYLKDEIAQVDKKIEEVTKIEEKKDKLNEKISLIQQLQASRPKIVHVFDELRRITPEGIYLTSFTQKADDLTISGKAQSNSRVSDYMIAIDKSISFTAPRLRFIKGQGGVVTVGEKMPMSDFTMILKVKSDKPEKDKDQDEVDGKGKKKAKKEAKAKDKDKPADDKPADDKPKDK